MSPLKSDDLDHSPVVSHVNWSFLGINVSKTKEVIVILEKKYPVSPVYITDHVVDVVEEYKYLVTLMDNRLLF